MDKILLYKLALFLPVFLVGIIEFFTAFRPGYLLTPEEAPHITSPTNEEKATYQFIIGLSTMLWALCGFTTLQSGIMTHGYQYVLMGQMIAYGSLFTLSVLTDERYHIINQHILRPMYLMPFVYSIYRIVTYSNNQLFDGITLGLITVMLIVLFFTMTSIGPSDFRIMTVVFMSVYPWAGPIVGLLMVAVGLVLAVIYSIQQKIKHKYTKKMMEERGIPIGHALLLPGLIFLMIQVVIKLPVI